MEIRKTPAAGKAIAHVGALVAAILMVVIAASAQQTPAVHATVPTRPSSSSAPLARHTRHNTRELSLPAGRQGATPPQSKQAQAANLKLLRLTPINPMAFAKTLRPPVANSSPKASAAQDSTVTEFRVASGGALSEGGVAAKNSKRMLLKNIHGEAYGALAPGLDGGHAAGAAVGASSKSGKTHVFIETDHRRDSSSH